jgi:uncharacterized repeat protein (TIGR01451 family)
MRSLHPLRKAPAVSVLTAGYIAMFAPAFPAHHATTAAATPTARTPTVPGLSINVSDGQRTARVGDRLSYTVNIKDSGMVAAPHLKITQTLQPGLRFLSASEHGVSTAGIVTWHAGVPAGGTRAFRVDTLVTRLPAGQLRLAVVACATVAGSSHPLVCAAHLDRLPASATAQPVHGAAAASGGSDTLAYTAVGLVVLGVAALAGIAGYRARRRARRSA